MQCKVKENFVMAIIEVLTVELGSSIAKAILKIWLRDHSIASDITSDLLGLIKGKTRDILAQHRAKRQFEAIGEKVAENLLPIFEAEKALLSGNSQTAIVLKISEILDNSILDARLLAEKDLEPAHLFKYLGELYPQRTKDFSREETEFFERILSEVCQNVIDIASELPSFTEQTLAEVLKRESDLIQKADLILEEVKRIRKSSEHPDESIQASLFENQYRRTVVRKLDELELFGADVSRASKRHRLSMAYVTLSVDAPVPEDDRIIEDKLGLDEQENHLKVISVEETILANPRLFVKGDAGSGKTTLLQWIAVRAALSDFKGRLGVLNEYTPFFIRLRQCVDKGLPAPEDFPALIAPTIAGTMPKGWVHERLLSGYAIVLVDGLDEISKVNRQDVKEWIRELVDHFPAARFILSSRPTAADEDWLGPEGFRESTLQPMTKQDIFAFIDHWHSAVNDALQDEVDKEELLPLAEKLKGLIEEKRSLYNLATTPLLCAMISALHRERRSQLPEDRIELYEACTSMLLERREVERKIDYRDYPKLTYRQKRALLNYFAYWLIKNKLSLVEFERADVHFEARVRIVEGLTSATGSDIRRLFLDRSGLLREPIKGSLHFAHRTFQEYLAAQAAIDEDDIGVLVSNAHDDQWREVVILGAGLAGQKKSEQLIADLIKRGDNEPKSRHQLHLLAIACLETSVLLAPDIKRELELRLKQLKLPRNMTEAKQWASAGELSIPYLSKGYKEKVEVTAACVRALLLIGGEMGLKWLEAFAKDRRSTVINELEKGLEYYDLDTYSKAVFSKNENFARIFRRIVSLTGIKYITYLESLTIHGDLHHGFEHRDYAINSLDAITNSTNMLYLKISGFSGDLDLAPIAKLSNLKFLVLDNLKMLESLADISQLENLETLQISNCERLTDIDTLRNFRKLRNLCIVKCNEIDDASALSELRELEALSLPGYNKITNLDFLLNCKNLKYLGLPYCSSLRDISTLSELTQIEAVSFCGCSQITDISSLLNLSELRILDLALCNPVVGVGIIQSLEKLRYLSLMGVRVNDLDKLSLSMPSLVAVNLIGVRAKQIEISSTKRQKSINVISIPQDMMLAKLYSELEYINRRKKHELTAKAETNDRLRVIHWERRERDLKQHIHNLEASKAHADPTEIDLESNIEFFSEYSNFRRRWRVMVLNKLDVEEFVYQLSFKQMYQSSGSSYNTILVKDLITMNPKRPVESYFLTGSRSSGLLHMR
jgi:hypothetical protein